MMGHAPYIALTLQFKLRAVFQTPFLLSASDCETLLVTGGLPEENSRAVHWLCDRLRALGADARALEVTRDPSVVGVTWGRKTYASPIGPHGQRRAA
jgi:hypothetical protein